MLKKILNLDGVQKLDKDEQSSLFGGTLRPGGGGCCDPSISCCVPQPIPGGCLGCATADPNCTFAYGTLNCPDPEFQSCCI